MAKKKPKLHVEVLLDHTGSMERDWPETVGAVNSYIETLLKAKDLSVEITLRLFSKVDSLDRVRKELEAKSGKVFAKLDPENDSLTPSGMTPLNEAICIVGEMLLEKHKEGDRVELCIVTDGLENASKAEFTRARALGVIKTMQDKEWLVKYLAATPESFRAAGNLGINPGSSAQYKGKNVGATLEAVSRSSYAYGVSGQSTCGDFTEQELRSMKEDK